MANVKNPTTKAVVKKGCNCGCNTCSCGCDNNACNCKQNNCQCGCQHRS